MNIIFFVLLFNYNISSSFSGGIDFYRLPDYSTQKYIEIINFDSDEYLVFNTEYFTLYSYFQITQPIGFDSREKESYGIEKHTMEMNQLELNFKYKFVDLSYGRIYSFNMEPFKQIDGFKINLNLFNFYLKYLQGSSVIYSDFLGKKYFFDNYKEIDYDYKSILFGYFYKKNNLNINYFEQLLKDDIVLKKLNFNLNGEYKSFYLTVNSKYMIDLNEINIFKAQTKYKQFGIYFDYYKPFFVYDSIFNIFDIQPFNKTGIFFENDIVTTSVYKSNNTDSFGIENDVYYLNFFGKINYLFDEYVEIYIGFEKNYGINSQFYYNFVENLYSYAINSYYKYNLIKFSYLTLYLSGIYNEIYNFQLKSGINFINEF